MKITNPPVARIRSTIFDNACLTVVVTLCVVTNNLPAWEIRIFQNDDSKHGGQKWMKNSNARKITPFCRCHCWLSACCKSCKSNCVKSENQWTHKYGCSPCQNMIFTILSRKSCCDPEFCDSLFRWVDSWRHFMTLSVLAVFHFFINKYWKPSKHQGQITLIKHNWKWQLWTRRPHQWTSAVFCS